jgi:hypothetical protein
MKMISLLVSVPLALAAAAHGDPARCCFTNQAYSGVCEVTPAKGETCADILAYLNNPQSSGKSYCGGTNVRGGWQSVTCKTGS